MHHTRDTTRMPGTSSTSTSNLSSASTSTQIRASTTADTNSPSLHPSVTQNLVDTGKYYCPFLERGFCRQSTRCNFSHDCQTATKIPTNFCHFYLANQCLYGQYCKFIHDEPLGSVDGVVDNDLSQSAAQAFCYQSDQDVAHQEHYDYNVDWSTYEQAAQKEEDDDHEGSLSPLEAASDRLQSNGVGIIQTKQSSSRVRFMPALPSLKLGIPSKDRTSPSPSSSSTSHDNNRKHTTTDQPIPRASKPSSSHDSNYFPIRALIANDPSGSNGCGSSSGSSRANTEVPISIVINTAKDSTNTTTPKAWQDGRLLASLKGESSSGNQGSHLKDLPLCPYSVANDCCPYPEGSCSYIHGQVCDLCSSACLHPYDEAQRRKHRDDCLREHEREMELSFAVQRSKDKFCGICMDLVVEKKPVTSSRFGILEKCNHIFCLDCIRKWRGTKQFDSKTIRACPECRVNSDFVVPSKYWIEDQEDKDKLIHDYKAALKSKPCRYFNEGKGDCPFAGSCFYKHAYPDGRLAEMEAPKPRRRLYGARGPASLTNYVLWSLIRSFEDDWSTNDDESVSRYQLDDDVLAPYYIDDDDDDDGEDEEDDGEEDEDDEEEEEEEENDVDRHTHSGERNGDENEQDDEAMLANIAEYTAPVW